MGFPIGSTIWALEARIDVAMAPGYKYYSWVGFMTRGWTIRHHVIQMISAAVFAMARYSDSQLDRETVGCFLALQDTKLPPRNMEYP
ncbi:hypothetical protein Tco_1001504 [Tanacetum coccineum]